ncbi:MAG: hypothetical protein ACRDSJ_24400 [Rubrobacteraceae bacterium]
MAMQALIMLAILAASAVIFTVVFVVVADRELAKPEGGERGEGIEESDGRAEREEGEGSGGGRDEDDGRRIGREEREDSGKEGEEDRS